MKTSDALLCGGLIMGVMFYMLLRPAEAIVVTEYEIIEYHHAIETCAPDDVGLVKLTFKDVEALL